LLHRHQPFPELKIAENPPASPGCHQVIPEIYIAWAGVMISRPCLISELFFAPGEKAVSFSIFATSSGINIPLSMKSFRIFPQLLQ